MSYMCICMRNLAGICRYARNRSKIFAKLYQNQEIRKEISESEPRGTPKARQEAKMNKRGLLSPSLAVLGAFFAKND